jgi:MFS family permease
MIALTTLVAVMLYLDRVCLSIVGEKIKEDQQITAEQYEHLLSAFFWAYALCQLPAGWLGDRYGPRTMLSLYLFFWSACTGMMGLASGFVSLLLLRLGCGMFEAGAYPLAAGIVRRWVPFSSRGMASGVVAVGGRLGGAVAPMLTAALAAGAVDAWRRPFLWYGLVGMLGAGVFWLFFRNRPEEHPSVNPAEAELITGEPLPDSPGATVPDRDENPEPLPREESLRHDGADQIAKLPSHSGPEAEDLSTAPVPVPPLSRPNPYHLPPLLAFVCNLPLWLNSVVQFLANFGWIFIITLFPTYLKEVFDTPIEMRAVYQALPLYAGIVGMLLGGWVTDRATRAFGLRWGRALPVAATRAIVGLAYVVALVAADPLSVAILMCVVAWATDAGNAPIWAYAQDVGGRHVGAVMGWANMWGNLGAAVTPLLFGWILRRYPGNPMAGWTAVFLVCAVVQVLGVLAALGLDSSKPIPGTEK